MYFNNATVVKVNAPGSPHSHSSDPNVLAHVTTKYDRTFGRCFQVEISKSMTSIGIINIEMIAR